MSQEATVLVEFIKSYGEKDVFQVRVVIVVGCGLLWLVAGDESVSLLGSAGVPWLARKRLARKSTG